MRKRIFISQLFRVMAVTCLVANLMFPLDSLASSISWVKEENKYICYKDDTRVYNSSIIYNGREYFIKEDGFMASDEIVNDKYYCIEGSLVQMTDVDTECNRIISTICNGGVTWDIIVLNGTSVMTQLNNNRLFSNCRVTATELIERGTRSIITDTKELTKIKNQYLYCDKYLTDVLTPIIYLSDEDKINFISNWIKEKFEYSDNLQHSVYDALINNETVCSGYASLFKVMCNKVGIRCDIITGTANNTQQVLSHAWNVVYLNNVPYYFDICWNDCVSKDKYYFMTKEQISIDHFEK